jgi:hypothetical protein
MQIICAGTTHGEWLDGRVYAAFCNDMHLPLHFCNHSLTSRFNFGT